MLSAMPRSNSARDWSDESEVPSTASPFAMIQKSGIAEQNVHLLAATARRTRINRCRANSLTADERSVMCWSNTCEPTTKRGVDMRPSEYVVKVRPRLHPEHHPSRPAPLARSPSLQIRMCSRTFIAERSAKVHRSTSASSLRKSRSMPRTAHRASARSGSSTGSSGSGCLGSNGLRAPSVYCSDDSVRAARQLFACSAACVAPLRARTLAIKPVRTVGPLICMSDRCVSAGRSASMAATQLES